MPAAPHIFECSLCHRVFAGRSGISPEGRSIWVPVKHGGTCGGGRPRTNPCPGSGLEAIITDQTQFAKIKHRLRKTPFDAMEEQAAAADPAERAFLQEIALASRLTSQDRFCEHVRIAVGLYVAEELAGVLENVARLKAALRQCLQALDGIDVAEESPLRNARDAAREALGKDSGNG